MSNNPYLQVALTYVRRPFASWAHGVLTILYSLFFILSIIVRPANGRPSGIWPIDIFLLSALLVTHVWQQVVNERVRLVPNFGRVHMSVAAAAALVVTVVVPTLMAWNADLSPIGPIAVAVFMLSAFLWWRLIQSRWLNFLLWATSMAFLFGLVPFEYLADLALVQHEGQSLGLLAVGVFMVVLGVIRIGQLDEDLPQYRRPMQRNWDQEELTNRPRAAAEEPLSHWLPGWLTRKPMARLIGHARNASNSRWARVRRWQAGVCHPSSPWLWTLGTILCLQVFNWRGTKPTASDLLFWLTVWPMIASVGQWCVKRKALAYELLLPVGRRAYIRQLFAVFAIFCFQLWCALYAGLILWWFLFAPQAPSLVVVANVFILSLLAQIGLFGMVIWLAKYRAELLMVGLVFVLIPLIGSGDAWLASWYSSNLLVAGLFAGFGLLATHNAYRRWLITDIS